MKILIEVQTKTKSLLVKVAMVIFHVNIKDSR